MEIPISFEKLRRITKLTDFQKKVEVGKEILKYLPELGGITFQEMINYIKTNKSEVFIWIWTWREAITNLPKTNMPISPLL